MLRVDRRLFLKIDWVLLGATALVVTASLVTLMAVGGGRAGAGVGLRQLVWLGVGAGALALTAALDHRRLVRWGPGLYGLGLGALVLVLLVGRLAGGARRWLAVGPLTVQPAEFFKLAFVLALVWLIGTRWSGGNGRFVAGVLALMAAVPFLLIRRQPDLGTALLLVPLAGVMLFAGGVSGRILGTLATLGAAALPFGWFVMKDYQRERLFVFLDSSRDVLGSAYNVRQAEIAIGSGQLTGRGSLEATQSRLAFLPEAHTDFVFAVFAEMWGFLGCLVLIGCYAVLLSRGFAIAAHARDPVGRLVATGATALLGIPVLVNVGMVLGLLPVVGVPLPLMSYGGSSLVASLAAVGLLLSVRMRHFT